MRWIFIGAGFLALVASTTMALNAAGGLSAPVAPGLVAMAFVLAVGAAAIGHALARQHIGLAIVIGLGMTAGEVGAMIQTAQRVTLARETQRAPLLAREERRQAALAELAAANNEVPEPISRPRLDAAMATKAVADRNVAEKATEKGCRENCRMLLQAAVDAASREVDAARADIDRAEKSQAETVATRLANARAAVAALPPPRSATPLADYSGMPEWVLDLIEALALSLAINLPASALIALGVKMCAPIKSAEVLEVTYKAVEPSPKGIAGAFPAPDPKRDPDIEAETFGVAVLRPQREAKLSPSELREAYLTWCMAVGHGPLPSEQIAPALGRLFRRAGIPAEGGLALGVAVNMSQFNR